MNKARILILLLLLALVLSGPVLAQVSPHLDLGWHVLSGGGGSRSSDHFQIDDVLGQWADGVSKSDRYQIEPGFWYTGRVLPTDYTYLPVVRRARG